ncbi:hypothetical protein [Kitasatospora sp. NPDC059160]|uniref:hypothetical protein n=1 Tax=Kitasatospora sp. NPDC059160 TaxID=3346748 RepID=UPI0036AE1172
MSTSATSDSSTATAARAIAEACRDLGIGAADPATLVDLQARLGFQHPDLPDRQRRLAGQAGAVLNSAMWVGADTETGRECLATAQDFLRRALALSDGGPGYYIRTAGGYGCALCASRAPETVTADTVDSWIDGHTDICDPALPPARRGPRR